MFSKFFPSCLLIVFVITSSPAHAESLNRYVGLNIGSALTSVNKLSDISGSLNTDFDPGYMVGLNVGTTFPTAPDWNIDRIRTEAEIAFRSNDLVEMRSHFGQKAKVDGTVSVTNFMLNGYLENTSRVTNDLKLNLFLTVGVGGAIASISSVSYLGTTLVESDTDIQFAYQGGFGAGYEIAKNITIEATYKYMGTSKFKFTGVDAEYGSNNIMFGTRYRFN